MLHVQQNHPRAMNSPIGEEHASAIRSPSLAAPGGLLSPITPGYRFGYDDHFETHHVHQHENGSARAPANTPAYAHTHSHEGHSHNMRGVFLHVMADTLGSVGVIISTILIRWYGWTGFDPIASLFIAVLISSSVLPLVIDTGKVLCLQLPDELTLQIEAALKRLKEVEEIEGYDRVRFWPKDASTLIGSIHVRTTPIESHGPKEQRRLDVIVGKVNEVLRGGIPDLEELTVQVEAWKDS
jgi:solute carrier family 30 (zinc transporter), member 5/7